MFAQAPVPFTDKVKVSVLQLLLFDWYVYGFPGVKMPNADDEDQFWTPGLLVIFTPLFVTEVPLIVKSPIGVPWV